MLEYAAAVWYPCMLKSNLMHLQQMQNKALRLILGVTRSSRIQDLHLEANIPSLDIPFKIITAYHAEKYRRHAADDPLYQLAHSLPPSRLKRKTWQHFSDTILDQMGIDTCRNGVIHRLDGHIPMDNRQPLEFTSQVATWNVINLSKVKIALDIPSL